MSDIFDAAADNDLGRVKEFVEVKGVSVTTTTAAGQTPAHIAANNGHSDIVKYLLSIDPSVVTIKNAWKQTILHLATQKCSLDVVKYLVDECNAEIYDANIFINGGSALHVAAAAGRLDVLKYFVEEKHVDPGLTDPDQQPVAFVAAECAQLPVIRYLVEKTKANMTTLNSVGNNILYMTVSRDNVNMSRYLLDEAEIKLDLNWKNRYGETVTHFAARRKSLNLVKYFVGEKHADINSRDNDGSTPLHSAASSGADSVCEYLVGCGADTQVFNYANKTPVMVAQGLAAGYFQDLIEGHRYRRSIAAPTIDEPASIRGTSIRRIAVEKTYSRGPVSVNGTGFSFALLDSILLLANVGHRHFTKTACQEKNAFIKLSAQGSIRARIDPIAVDAIETFSNFENVEKDK